MPPILLTREEPDTGVCCEIRATAGVWSVLYDRQTFSEVRIWPGNSSLRYERSIYGTPGTALRAARALNAAYGTTLFTVHRMMICSAALPDPKAKP